jgi:hypothetical protein
MEGVVVSNWIDETVLSNSSAEWDLAESFLFIFVLAKDILHLEITLKYSDSPLRRMSILF